MTSAYGAWIERAPIPADQWDGCPEPWLRSGLEAVARATGATDCVLAWRRAADRPPALLGVGTAEPSLATIETWLATLAPGPASPLDDESGWAAPLLDVEGDVAGVLLVNAPESAPRVGPLVSATAEHLSLLLNASRIDRDSSAGYRALIEIGSQLHAEAVNADATLALIVDRARHLVGTDVAWLALVDEDHERIVLTVASGATTDGFIGVSAPVGAGVAGLAVQERRTIVVRDRAHHPTTGTPAQTHQAVEGEGLVSITSVPMFYEGGAIGALCVGNRRPTDFTENAVSLLTALASQAAISIVNSRLYKALSEKNDTLERTFAIHRSLTDASLSGAGMHDVAAGLASLIERDVVVATAEGTPRCWRYCSNASPGSEPEPLDPAQLDPLPGDAGVSIVAGEEQLGSVHALGGRELSDLDRNALEQGATVIALEMMKRRAAQEVEWRLRGELLEELLEADGDWSDGLRTRCERLGVDPDQERCIAVLEPVSGLGAPGLLPLIYVAFRRLIDDGTTLVSKRGDRILVALALGPADAVKEIQTLLTKAEKAALPACAGLSSTRLDLKMALREAQAAVGLIRGKRSGLLTYEQLGPLRFLLDASDTVQMEALVRDTLGPLAEYDAARKSQMMVTLRAYLESGGHHPTTAAACHIHVSTLKYRLSRIAELLGRPLTNPDTLFELRLGLAVLDVLEMMGIRPLRTG